MTRPDARLLVPVSALPGGRAPQGALVWCERPTGWAAGIATVPDGADVYVVWIAGRAVSFVPPSSLYLDLSRPDVVDGADVRLDALGWALGVLGWVCVERVGEAFRIVGRDPTRGAPWPDLSGLSDDAASRAVVAAALRGGA